MPYINQARREQLNPIITEMYEKNVDSNGDINYILYAYFKRYFDVNYNEVKNYIAELTECGAEIRRRILGPHEDGKVKDNGDI